MTQGTLLPLLGLNCRVQVHPVVLLSICDAFIRRNDKQERVIGSLLGTVTDGLVSVQRCYVVPHNESADQASRGVPQPGPQAARQGLRAQLQEQ